jgi:hypothetical protein
MPQFIITTTRHYLIIEATGRQVEEVRMGRFAAVDLNTHGVYLLLALHCPH